MAQLFFYGSLRHLPLLEIVLGRKLAPDDASAAILPGYAAYAVAGQPFPLLLAEDARQATGLAVRGVSATDLERLDFYEGGFGYDLKEVTLAGGEAAQVFVCAPGRWQADGLWDFDAWVARWGAMSCHAAREVMGHMGRLDPEQIAQLFPQIRARAWSKVLAAQSLAGQGVLAGKVEIAQQVRAYTGYFALDEVRLRHSRFDGSLSPFLDRSYFVASDASLVLPYDPLRDRVLLVEQMRVGPLGRGDGELWHLEPVAGRIDPGESPEEAAHREAREEAGLVLHRLETVARGYPSPGDSTGYFHIFVGLADLPDDAAGLGGLESEAEDIRARLVSFDDFIAMAERQSLANTPLALLAYWLAHHRSRLRS